MKNQYSGNKIVKRWIESNVFFIHEYAVSKNPTIYAELLNSLRIVLKSKTRPINIEQQTKFHDWIKISFTCASVPQVLLIIDKFQKHTV